MTPDWQELELDDALISVLKAAGLNKPAKVQQAALPAAMDDHDLLISSPTGTGKTLAFLLPVLQHMMDFPRKQPGAARALILAPTRELAEQIYQQAEMFRALTELSSVVVTGGVNYGSQLSRLEQSHDIVIATPGRLLDLLEAEQYELEAVEWLVIDEADRMLDMGFKGVVKDIALHARNRQHAILCSATIESDGVKAFSRTLLNEPELIEVTPPKRERGKIIEHAYLADTDDHKRQLLMALLKQHSGRSIVFARTRERVQALASFLQSQDVPVMFLRGDLPHAERQQKIIEFKRRDNAVLVATDVASRGLDIDDIKLVINYDLPKQADVYVHRIGRTARAGQKGLAISLVEAHDALLLGKIERYMEHRLDRRVIDGLKPQYKFPSTDKKRVKKKKQNKKTKKRR